MKCVGFQQSKINKDMLITIEKKLDTNRNAIIHLEDNKNVEIELHVVKIEKTKSIALKLKKYS